MDAFIGEIRLMGGNFAPKGWLTCSGQTLAIAQNQALFSLLGTTYGGNGTTTFNLPDLRGRVALGFGQGPGLQPYNQGQVGGSEGVTLNSSQMPQHFHVLNGSVKVATAAGFPDAFPNYPADSGTAQYAKGTSNASLNGGTLQGSAANAGGNQPHDNRQPVMAMNYCIAITGVFPSRG